MNLLPFARLSLHFVLNSYTLDIIKFDPYLSLYSNNFRKAGKMKKKRRRKMISQVRFD